MTDPYFILKMDNLLNFISKHQNINFKFASEIVDYANVTHETDILPYLFGINKYILKRGMNQIKKIFEGTI